MITIHPMGYVAPKTIELSTKEDLLPMAKTCSFRNNPIEELLLFASSGKKLWHRFLIVSIVISKPLD